MKKFTFFFLALLCSGLMSAEIFYDVKIGDLYYNLNTTTQTAQVSGIVNGFSGDLVIPDSVKYDNPYANLNINIESPAEGYVTLVIEIPEGSECNGIAFKGSLDGSSWTGANQYLGEYGSTTVSQCIQFELISGTTNLYKATFRLGEEVWGEGVLMSGKVCLIYANDAYWQGQATDWSAENFSTADWGRSGDGNILIYSSGIVYMHIDGWQDTECAPYSNYNLTVHVPNMCSDFNLEVIGSFCNWNDAQAVTMTQVSSGVYTATIFAKENAQWKVRGEGDWGKEIQYYDNDSWKAVPNYVLGSNLNVTVDYSDNDIYRWSVCAEEEEIPRRLNATSLPHRTQASMQTFRVTSIGSHAFNNCRGLSSVTIPESVTTIGEWAFYGCTGLTSVTWNAINCSTNSDSYNRPFDGCSNISSFVFGNQVQKIPDYLCYELTQISSITIPNTVTYIGQSAFKDCNVFNSLIVSENVDTIGSNAFEGCNNLSLVIWNARNCVSGYWYNTYALDDNDNYIYEWRNGYNSPFPSSVGTIIFGDYVQQVPRGLCRGLNQLTSIALPNTVTKIGEYAFKNCSGLISVTMEEGVQTIGDDAFGDCTNLPQIVIPNSVTKIGHDAFGRCSNLTTATIGNHVDTIGSDAFISCERLMSIELPTSVSYIGISAFHGCLSMNKAIVHSTAELDPLCMILLNPQIDTIVAPASIFDIDEYYRLNYVVTKRMKYVRATTGELTEDAFAVIRRSASTLETLDMAGTTNTSLADEAFSNMYRLRALALPSGVTEISYKAAAECVNLTQVTIPASVETIGQRAFENCRSLQAVIFSGNNLQTIGNWAFYNNHALRQITIPAGVTTVGDGAFYGCNYLEELAMPASLRNVGDNAFALCNHLTKMQVEATLPPQVAARTFFDVNRAIPVYVPDEAVNDYRTTQVWQEFFIRPISQAATGIGEVEQDGQEGTGMLPDGKFMQNGQLFIRKNGRVYDTQGRLIE